MTTESFTVEGMTCAHCAMSVTREVKGVAGVTDASVDLQGKKVTVSGEFTEAEVAAAVAEAGYTLAGRL